MNNWAISGFLGQNPKMNVLPSGEAVLNLSVAVNRRAKVKGEWVDQPIWTDVTLFGKRCQWLHDNLQKGSLVEAVGELSVRTYEGRDGERRTQIELYAREVKALGPRSAEHDQATHKPEHRERSGGTRPGGYQPQQAELGHYEPEDNLPF